MALNPQFKSKYSVYCIITYDITLKKLCIGGKKENNLVTKIKKKTKSNSLQTRTTYYLNTELLNFAEDHDDHQIIIA